MSEEVEVKDDESLNIFTTPTLVQNPLQIGICEANYVGPREHRARKGDHCQSNVTHAPKQEPCLQTTTIFGAFLFQELGVF